jgi:hypothetical protein
MQDQIMPSTLDPLLAGLSYIISVLGSFTALQLAIGIPNATNSRERIIAIVAAGAVMGGGAIWSMHFIAMLAWKMDMPVAYDLPITLGSALIAMLSCMAGLAIVGSGIFTTAKLVLGGLLMGLGVSGMHYAGMSAMQIAGHDRLRRQYCHPVDRHSHRGVHRSAVVGFQHARHVAANLQRVGHGYRSLRHALHRHVSGNVPVDRPRSDGRRPWWQWSWRHGLRRRSVPAFYDDADSTAAPPTACSDRDMTMMPILVGSVRTMALLTKTKPLVSLILKCLENGKY